MSPLNSIVLASNSDLAQQYHSREGKAKAKVKAKAKAKAATTQAKGARQGKAPFLSTCRSFALTDLRFVHTQQFSSLPKFRFRLLLVSLLSPETHYG